MNKKFAPISDAEFQQIFKLDAEDVILKTVPAEIIKLKSLIGTFYVSNRCICFYARVFGSDTKVIVLVLFF